MSYCFVDTKVLLGKDEKVPGMVDGGNGCTTMWMYLMTAIYTLKNSLNDKFYAICIYHLEINWLIADWKTQLRDS